MTKDSLTIRSAILRVFAREKRPMFPEEIYTRIIENNLYNFNTDSPLHVVKTRLRRDCVGLEFAASSKNKYFQLLSDGSYWLKGKEIPKGIPLKAVSTDSQLNTDLQKSYEHYFSEFKAGVLNKLRKLSPPDFEAFCKNFIKAYGFVEVRITPSTRDGGIDGFGKLRLGFTHLDVAFECKRWNNTEIRYDIVRRFRGSIPTRCVYGIIFTTSSFSKSAKNETERDDMKPVVLMDGDDIVDFMIKNDFGVGKEQQLIMYSNQIDLALSDD